MPYPAKTNAQIILAVAIDSLEQYGEESLSIRELANRLGISPRALYRYYPDRAALDDALAEEVFRRLRSALVDAVGTRVGKEALRAGAIAYLEFAQAHPAWYAMLAKVPVQTPGLAQAEHAMWTFVLGLIENVVGQEVAPSASVALWAFLHGFIGLENAAVLGDKKPKSGFQVGLEIFLAGLSSLPSNSSL